MRPSPILHGPEVVANSDRLHAVRLGHLQARSHDESPPWVPDCGQVRLEGGTWKAASRVTSSDVIAVRGKGEPC